LIKVLVGQRRVGKSFILYQIMDEIEKANPDSDIIYINKELFEFDSIKDYTDLVKYIYLKRKSTDRCHIFIDEIQDITGFEKALRSLKAEGGFDIYCTGSNANLLSGEFATYLSGRYVEFRIFSLTYKEFLSFHSLNDDSKSFEKYFRFGGLPYLVNLKLEEDQVNEYLRSIFNTIILKDVVERYNIRNIRLLKDLTVYLADNPGNLLSAGNISVYLKSQKITATTRQILSYLEALLNAFFIEKVKRADVSGKRIFEIGEKYYFEDMGLRNTLVPFKARHIGSVMENIVCHNLLVNGYTVYTGKLAEREIDFIAERRDERIYIQVAFTISEEKTYKREFGNLLSIKDNYPKYVITMDEYTGRNEQGIICKSLRKWLLED
jgi:hypothetical protein